MNLDKLDAAIAWIEANPQLHDQADPFAKAECGTTMCLAGVVCMLDGWEPEWNDKAFDGQLAYWVRRGADDMNAMGCARDILDADGDQAHALFIGADDLADIKALRDEYAATTAGEAGERSDTPNASDLGGDR